MNKKTASSAEIVVLSFKGLENVHYFEQNSAVTSQSIGVLGFMMAPN